MTQPSLLLAGFIGLVALLWKIERHPRFSRLFQFLPVPFWCYVLPMMATTLGWIPAENPLYPFLSRQLLPVCLVLLLIGTNLPALTRLGPTAILLMLAGSAGIVLGGISSFFLYQRWLPEGSWGSIGALAGSWTGGSANLLAVKEALQLPDPLVAPIIIVDAAVAYSWMALLIGCSSFARQWDDRFASLGGGQAGRGRHTGRAGMVSPATKFQGTSEAEVRVSKSTLGICERSEAGLDPTQGGLVAMILAVMAAVAISFFSQKVAGRMPTVGQVLSSSGWTILIVTTVALGLSLTPARRLGGGGASRGGSFALYVLLASIGARASLSAVAQAPVFLALGLTWIVIHGIVILAAGILLRAPLGLIATASQANIGGVVSAPLVGATFSKELAGIGLLMAILGNILGTYLGLATAGLARLICR